ncbi:MAG: BREX system ATP-binding domain-containing protein [Candidatus Bathyarchaeia archaeon]|jgi:tetratricopeptide (TPR) repeat protein
MVIGVQDLSCKHGGKLNSTLLPEPILVGRERELEALKRYLESASDGKGATVFISGEAGTGKTRLVNEFLRFAKQERDIITLTGWCLYNAGVPYFPFIEAFTNYFSILDSKDSDLELDLNSWLKGPSRIKISGKYGYLSPQALKDQTFEAINRVVSSMSANKPLVIFIDDVHWADSASLALLHYISRSIAAQKVLVLVTYRSEELTVNGEGHPHPLTEGLHLMGRENLFKELKLENLKPNDVLTLAESMVGGLVDPEFACKLAGESQGNPLFIVESLKMLAENGALVEENERWNISADKIGIPKKVKDIILRRAGSLRPDQRKLLDVASVIGSKFDPELLAKVCSQTSLQALEALNGISRSSSLLVCEENAYQFDHAKTRDAIYEEIPLPLRKAYHRWVAEKLEAIGNDQKASEADLAYHYTQAGDEDKAVKHALAAGQDALAKWSNQQAIEHFSYALKNISNDVEERRIALEGLGDAYAANCMYAEAIKTFDQLAASESGRVRLRAIRKAMDAAFLKGDKPDLLLECAKKAEELAAYDRLEMARVLDNRGRAFNWAGRGDVRLDVADYEAALKVFEEENSIVDIAEALGRSGEAAISLEDLREKAIGELLRSRAIFGELGDMRKEIEATLRLGYGFECLRFSAEVRRELAKVLAVGEKLGVFVELARANGILSLLCENEGKLAEALSLILKALEYCNKTDAKYIEGLDLAALTRIYSMLGDLERAYEYCNRMKKLPPGVLSGAMAGKFILLSEGVYFAARGCLKESNQTFEKLDKLGWEWLDTAYVWALEKQGRFEEAKIQRNKIRELLRQTEEQFAHAKVQLCVITPRKIVVRKEFEMRLDTVNVARNSGSLVKVDGILPSDVRVVSLPSFCSLQNNSIELNKTKIGPFEVKSLKLKMAFMKDGAYDLRPSLSYLTDEGEIGTSEAKPIAVTVQNIAAEDKLQSVAQAMRQELKFESPAAEKAFDFLVSAFREDYLKRRLPEEKSGWRTMIEIVKASGITMNSMYGRSGRGGKARLELGRLRLVESRFFHGERGRGGSVLKLRIRREGVTVKQRFDQQRDRE